MARWSPRAILIATLAVGLTLMAGALLKDAKRERFDVVATPSPPGVFSHPTVAVKPGERICVAPFAIPADADLGQILLMSPRRGGGTLRVEVAAPSGRAVQTLQAPDAAGTVTPSLVRLPKPADSARLCARNVGDTTVQLVGTNEGRFQTQTKTSVDGRPNPVTATLVLVDSRPHPLLGRFDDAVADTSKLTGGIPRVLLWALLAFVVLGIPAATVVAVLSTDPDD